MILGIYGESKTGKTTLISRLIAELRKRDYSVGSVKNIHQSNFTIDTEGKDTWEHTNSGSLVVVARSKDEVAFLVNHPMSPTEVAANIKNFVDLDIVLVEGYWEDDSPKIVLGNMEEKPNTLLRYEDNFDEVLEYVMEGIEKEKVEKKLPGLDCGKCGFDTCSELAESIFIGKKNIVDCYYFSDMNVSLKVDGKEIPLGKFAKEFVAGTVWGMVSSLKGVEGGQKIMLTLEK